MRGATVTLHGERSYTYNFATVNNNSLLTTSGGTIDIQANLHQAAGSVAASGGGTVMLEGETDGGTIEITNATLAFGLVSRASGFGPGGDIAGAETLSPVKLAGRMDILDFGYTGMSIAFNAKTNELNVTGSWSGGTYAIADMRLAGHYSANEFSVVSDSVVYRV